LSSRWTCVRRVRPWSPDMVRECLEPFCVSGIDDPVWDHSVFSKNRDRLPTSEIAQHFFAALLAEQKVKRLLSHEHFSVDGTLLNAASMTSLPRLARDRAQPVALLLLPALSQRPRSRRAACVSRTRNDPARRVLRLARGQAEAAGDAQGAEGTEGLAGYPLRAGPEADHRVDWEANVTIDWLEVASSVVSRRGRYESLAKAYVAAVEGTTKEKSRPGSNGKMGADTSLCRRLA
jgi:hypothetical protein